MKKPVIVLAALIALVFIFPGCGPGEAPEVEAPGVVPEPEKEDPLEYELVEDLNALPGEVQSAASQLKGSRGYFVFSEPEFATGEDVFLLVFSGEKVTGGYSIVLDSLDASRIETEVVVEETEPKEKEAVIQVLTYPLLAIKLSGTSENYTVENTANDQFESLVFDDEIDEQKANGTEKNREIERKTGIYSGQIDSNFVEIEIEGQAKAFMLPQDLSGILARLDSGDRVNLSYYENEHGQLVIEEIGKK